MYKYSDVIKTIQCAHPPPHRHNGFVAICWLWTASGGVHALLVFSIYIYNIYIYILNIYIYIYIYIMYITLKYIKITTKASFYVEGLI